jgi:hypothetical protein
LFLLLSLGLMVGLVSPAIGQPLDPNGTFVDDNGSIFEPSIEAIADVGVTQGCNPPVNDAYCPAQPVTRAEMASFLVRALSLSGPVIPSTTDAFVDDDGSVHEDNINTIAELGITKGCNPPTNDAYCPNVPVSRGQMAAFLARAFGFVDDDPGDRFVDDDTSIFEDNIEAIAAAGVTLGCNPPDNDRFCPDDPVTRAQMAAFLTRALGLTPLVPPAVGDAALVRPVFLLDQPSGGPFLAALARYVPAGSNTPEGAVTALLEGLDQAELDMVPAFSTEIPEGTELLDLTVAGGDATVDLSGEFDDGGGSASMFSRLGQLTFTLTAYPDIDVVHLELDGTPVTVFSSEGIDISGGLDPEYFFDLGVMPEVFPQSPAAFEFVASPFDVAGWSRAFEATINWELYDRDGLLLADGFETTGASGPEFGVMSFDVAYSVSERQVGTLMVFEISAMDGSRINLREVPLWLEP